MCYLALSLSLFPCPPHSSGFSLIPAQCHIFALLICEMWTRQFNSSGHNLTSVARISLRFEGDAAMGLCRCGSGAAAPEYQMSCRRFVWLRRGFASIVFPISQTPLSGGSRHSCCWLLIPLLFRNRLQPSGSTLSERLRKTLVSFSCHRHLAG